MSKSNQSSDLFFKSKSGHTFHAVDFKMAAEAAFEEGCLKPHEDKIPAVTFRRQTTALWVDHFNTEVTDDTELVELNFDHPGI